MSKEKATCSKQLINRLKRAEGQVRGIQRMIEEDQDCLAVVTQLSAVRSSIDRIMGLVIAENMKDCYLNPVENELEQQKRLEKAIEMVIKK
ncbi:metal-sensitive transcriptional regulator [Vagococcus sp.]|uniref:metal-sensitive transcriptional regulator n=1 Tax=Vagococcus sp. TaxID=1933889 RepID=UPI003F999BBA